MSIKILITGEQGAGKSNLAQQILVALKMGNLECRETVEVYSSNAHPTLHADACSEGRVKPAQEVVCK